MTVSEVTSPRPAPRERGRIEAIDVARGFALFGIFLVNIDFFARPLGAVMTGGHPEGGWLDVATWWFVATLCTGKFYPLFSMLFGIGLVLQRRSIESRGGRFVPIYLRRTFLLMAIGFVHGVFVWYGDILFIYSFAALVLLACSRLSARWLLGIGAGLVVFSIGLTGALGALGAAFSDMAPPAAESASAERTEEGSEEGEALGPFRQWLELAPEMSQGPEDPRWMALETRAYQEGGYLDTMGFRVLAFVGMLVAMLFGGGWHVLAMFFVGAGLCRMGLFEASASGLRRRLLAIAWALGLPLAIVASVLKVAVAGDYGVTASALVNFVAGPLIAIGYLLGWIAVVETGALGKLTDWLAATGRMALSNYLAQSIVASAVMYYWGLGLFGTTTQFTRVLFVAVVFMIQIVSSALWMKRFRFGPMEWLWRSATYWRAQPMRRT